MAAVTLPEIEALMTHLRQALGDRTYELLSQQGREMTTTAMVTFAADQIDQARAELEHSG
jgi:hypothetical protein